MSKATQDVFDDAMALSEEDRARLAEQLVESLDAQVEPGAEDAWAAELERRLARIEAGQAKGISMAEAVARLHRAAQGR